MKTEIEDIEIIEGNKLIAEFMGGVKSRVDGDTRYIRFTQPHAGTETYAFYKWNLKYHSSWDWLMPVVEKIESLQYFVRIENDNIINKIYTTCSISDAVITISESMMQSKIESAWYAVIQFIQWYNKQKQ